jgi:hypothetical protein
MSKACSIRRGQCDLRLAATFFLLSQFAVLAGCQPTGSGRVSTIAPLAQATPEPAGVDEIFKFDIPFQRGATQFLPGDQITITRVTGTSADMQSGVCRITGSYRLWSHDRATIAASITAAESKDAVGPWNAAQTMTLQKGTGTFTVLLPVSIQGWPHVSFYDGSSFGGIYLGTGDWVLEPGGPTGITDTTAPAAMK